MFAWLIDVEANWQLAWLAKGPPRCGLTCLAPGGGSSSSRAGCAANWARVKLCAQGRHAGQEKGDGAGMSAGDDAIHC